jgi:two-component system, sporulation sensor kinase D
MKIHKKDVLLYVLIVILPIISFGFYYYYHILKETNIKKNTDAKWIASMYQKNWDQFIGETITSLKVVSLSAVENMNNLQTIEPLLQKVNHSDPRYGGLYLLDSHGKLLSSSESFQIYADFSSRDYIQEIMKTKDTVISNHQEVLPNNQKILGLATPVLDENNQLEGILVAYLRTDYMINLMRVFTPDTKLYILNEDNHPVLEINTSKNDLNNKGNWVTKPLDRLPWTIKVKVSDQNTQELRSTFGKAIFLVLVLTHILFLMIEYILLRKNTVKERKENEIQKLELVGTLAASTAHEIRNPLTGVKGLIQLLSEKYPAPEDQYYFEIINSELKRINEIVSEFLILGKPTVQLNEKVDIAATLHELKPLIISEGNTFNIECHWQIPNEPVMVNCVKDQMKQVILNVTRNAFESMSSNGILQVNLHLLDNYCKLQVIDNGKGISKDNLDKIFRPFYTSKETGTGLGLVICKRIIQSFNGEININSTESVGTEVGITLPIVKNKRV